MSNNSILSGRARRFAVDLPDVMDRVGFPPTDLSGGASRRRVALFGAAASMSVAMTAGLAAPLVPEAKAASFDAVSSGLLFAVANALGYHSFEFDIPIIGRFAINIDNVDATSSAVGNAINAVPFSELLLGTRNPLVLSEGQGAYATATAYRALTSSAQGNTWAGYSALSPGSEETPNVTNEVLGLIWNPTRPNGGLYARFAPIANIFGIDTVLAPAGVPEGQQSGIRLNTATLDVTTAYSFRGDFPETINPFSLVNSFMASVLPTYLLDGGQLLGLDTTSALLDIAGLLTLGRYAPTGGAYFGTYLANDLPILELMRLPVHLINLVSKLLGHTLDLPTPIADALQPALTILVNIGYTDVQTPSDGGTYNRTFDDAGIATPFMSVRPLTPQEWIQVPGDVIRAVVDGVFAEIGKLLVGSPQAAPAASSSAASAGVAAGAVDASLVSDDASSAELVHNEPSDSARGSGSDTIQAPRAGSIPVDVATARHNARTSALATHDRRPGSFASSDRDDNPAHSGLGKSKVAAASADAEATE